MNSNSSYPLARTPLLIGGKMRLKNRIVVNPHMSGLSTPDGQVTDAMIAYYGRLARTGAALVEIGDSIVGGRKGFDHLTPLDMSSIYITPGLAALADEVHRYGAKISIELSHGGIHANPLTLQGEKPLAPSPWPSDLPKWEFGKYVDPPEVITMDHAMIAEVRQQFVDAVGHCVDAGFDAVTIHCGHGWLLTQFLSPLFNQRTDEYGGSFENRCRFPLEILKAIKDAYGDRIALGVRINGSTRAANPKEITDDELLQFAIKCANYADWANVSASWNPHGESVEYMCQSYYLPHKVNSALAQRMKNVLPIPVVATGSIETIQEAEELLNDGWCDLVGICRANIAADSLVSDAFRGQEDKTRPCIRCCVCTMRMVPPSFRGIRCSVNPVIGRERESFPLAAAPHIKRVMIVGGGPAGMQAAQTAVARGHDVTLYEKADRLGGTIHTAAALPDKYDMRRWLDWMIHTTTECGAKIRLNTTVTPEMLVRESPDAVIIAIGSKPSWPGIPGLNPQDILWAGDVDERKVETGDTVLVAGAGLTGVECAIPLAKAGKQVTVIDRIPPERFAADAQGPVLLSLMRIYQELKIRTIFHAEIISVTDQSITYRDKNGTPKTIYADSVINALGTCLDQKLLCELSSIIPETYLIGDANGNAPNIRNAIDSGYTAALRL